ncbi:MAG: hypothetical protein GAK40_00707 [Burkholderia plantarii]|nr:MAG: hypothetical protein GAK40_00707 [Burkholderia plantarii]
MIERQRPAARGGQRRRPRNPGAGRAGTIGDGAALPSDPAAVMGDEGIRPMAQRFFIGSAITPFTGDRPVGSAGR